MEGKGSTVVGLVSPAETFGICSGGSGEALNGFKARERHRAHTGRPGRRDVGTGWADGRQASQVQAGSLPLGSLSLRLNRRFT